MIEGLRARGAILAKRDDVLGMTSITLRPKVTGFAARLALGVVLALALFAATAAAWTLARARGS